MIQTLSNQLGTILNVDVDSVSGQLSVSGREERQHTSNLQHVNQSLKSVRRGRSSVASASECPLAHSWFWVAYMPGLERPTLVSPILGH